MQFTSIEAPGAPEAQLAAMREAMGRPRTESSCVTPEQAAHPTGTMLNPGGQNCQFTDNVFAGGTIRVHGTCQQPGGTSARMNMDGTYTATTMNVHLSSEMTMPAGMPGPRSLRMSGTMTGRRTGDCAAR
jgi:hypothetical protein